ncbi:hypothetical protein [Krasilnikovia sp. MM14-A1259]|uniref:hypothetical protein n=1 Tax=Krasilnikovia sp. MM14-A1259 TaxID=3373539 RepID=UPI00380DF413
MSSDAPLPEPGPPSVFTSTPEPALIDLSAPPPAPQTQRARRYLRAVFVPSAPGRVAYGLAWLCILTLAVSAMVFPHLKGDTGRILVIVFSAVGVLAAVCLHLAAVSVNRRRDMGYSLFATGLIVLLVLPAAYVTFMMASVGAVMSNAFGEGGDSAPATSFSAGPGDDSGEDSGPDIVVACEAPDGSMVNVDPDLCIDGHYTP